MTEVAVPVERKNFSKIRSFMDLPNLIDVQRRSYERFLQMNLLSEAVSYTHLTLPTNSRV